MRGIYARDTKLVSKFLRRAVRLQLVPVSGVLLQDAVLQRLARVSGYGVHQARLEVVPKPRASA